MFRRRAIVENLSKLLYLLLKPRELEIPPLLFFESNHHDLQLLQLQNIFDSFPKFDQLGIIELDIF